LGPSGAALYSTYLGGSGDDSGSGIAVDTFGDAYITGSTSSTNFPTANAPQAVNGGLSDGFVVELNAAGSALAYSTYLGGASFDQGYGIAVDGGGAAYVTGFTESSNFPVASALQPLISGTDNVFVAKIPGAIATPPPGPPAGDGYDGQQTGQHDDAAALKTSAPQISQRDKDASENEAAESNSSRNRPNKDRD
jgi:hypothetical protein